jgi:hypothetical protein
VPYTRYVLITAVGEAALLAEDVKRIRADKLGLANRRRAA